LSPINTGKGLVPGEGRGVMTSYEARIRDALTGLSPSFELLIDRKTDPGTTAEAAANALREVERSLELTRRGFPVEMAEGLIVALDEAERVIVMAEGLALPPARSLGAWLESVGYTIHLTGGSPPELARAVAGIRNGDLIVAVVATEETPFVAQALAEARNTGARTAALLAAPSWRYWATVGAYLRVP